LLHVSCTMFHWADQAQPAVLVFLFSPAFSLFKDRHNLRVA
jgi:hypothetical protein